MDESCAEARTRAALLFMWLRFLFRLRQSGLSHYSGYSFITSVNRFHVQSFIWIRNRLGPYDSWAKDSLMVPPRLCTVTSRQYFSIIQRCSCCVFFFDCVLRRKGWLPTLFHLSVCVVFFCVYIILEVGGKDVKEMGLDCISLWLLMNKKKLLRKNSRKYFFFF